MRAGLSVHVGTAKTVPTVSRSTRRSQASFAFRVSAPRAVLGKASASGPAQVNRVCEGREQFRPATALLRSTWKPGGSGEAIHWATG